MDVEESLAEAADIAAFIGHTRDVGSSNEENIVDLETNLGGVRGSREAASPLCSVPCRKMYTISWFCSVEKYTSEVIHRKNLPGREQNGVEACIGSPSTYMR